MDVFDADLSIDQTCERALRATLNGDKDGKIARVLFQQRDESGRSQGPAERMELSCDEPQLQVVVRDEEDLRNRPTLIEVFIRALLRKMMVSAVIIGNVTYQVTFQTESRQPVASEVVRIIRAGPPPKQDATVATREGPMPAAWAELEATFMGAARTIATATRIAAEVLSIVQRALMMMQEHYGHILGLIGKENVALRSQIYEEYEAHRKALVELGSELINLKLGGEAKLIKDQALAIQEATNSELEKERTAGLLKMGDTLIGHVGTMASMYVSNKMGGEGGGNPALSRLAMKIGRYPELMAMFMNPDFAEALDDERTRVTLMGLGAEIIKAVQEDRAKKKEST